jgi:hypothetical protein
MYAIANCRISIFRGTVKDEGGDDAPSNVPVRTGLLASVEEHRSRDSSTSATVQGNVTSTPRQVRSLIGKVGSNVDVRIHDRVLLEATGERYVVINVTQPHKFGRTPDKVLFLKQVT